MSRLHSMLGLFLLLLAGAGLLGGCKQATHDGSPGPASAMERVTKSGEIRCSYLVYSPYIRKDPNTGKLSGVFYEVMEELTKSAGLKVVWAEEVGYENIFAGLDAGRHDVFCGGLWPNASRAKAGYFTIPIFYSVIKTWVRPDEKRFSSLADINQSTVRIAAIDGAMEDIIARTDYPEAKRESLPQLSPFTQNLLNITSRKADITFAEPGIVTEFLQTNPGALKEIFADKPQRIFGNSLVVRRGDNEFKQFLDIGLMELLYTGRIDKILAKYEPAVNVFPRVALPYRLEPAK